MPQNTIIALYDDRCSLCTLFAQFIRSLTRNNIELVGHYSQQGATLRKNMLETDALEMFWIINRHTAYGGRAAILPLLKTAAISCVKKQKKKEKKDFKNNKISNKSCHSASDCSGVKHVFIRSASLIRNSRTIRIHH